MTRPESIAAAIEASGPIDVLVNNEGIGIVGAFEATPMATVREVFETNTFGVMGMTQAVLPLFRERRSGVVVNVWCIIWCMFGRESRDLALTARPMLRLSD